MAHLTAAQVARFEEEGYLVVEGLLDPRHDLAPVIEEYAEVLDRLAHDLHDRGEISSIVYEFSLWQAPYPDLCRERQGAVPVLRFLIAAIGNRR